LQAGFQVSLGKRLQEREGPDKEKMLKIKGATVYEIQGGRDVSLHSLKNLVRPNGVWHREGEEKTSWRGGNRTGGCDQQKVSGVRYLSQTAEVGSRILEERVFTNALKKTL